MKKKAIRLIIVIYIALALLSTAAVFSSARVYNQYIYNPTGSDNIKIEYENGGIVEGYSISTKKTVTHIKFKALKKGSDIVSTTVYHKTGAEDGAYSTTYYLELKSVGFGMLFVDGRDFNGYKFIYLGIGVGAVFTAAILLYQFNYRRKNSFFSYRTVLDLALALYCSVHGIANIALFILTGLLPLRMSNLYFDIIGYILSIAVLVSIPFIIIFALFLSVSNLSLIRHEGFAKNNLFGILISAFMIIGAVVCVIIAFVYPYVLTYNADSLNTAFLRVITSSIFVYFECIMLAVGLCCFYCVKFKPAFDKDFIIILGCKIRADGTPLPLLRGRIDRAIRFYKDQLEATGKKACFIPSGGQGEDEIMSEAESMKNYLLEQGIDSELILPETKSTTTLENMLFSSEIAKERAEESKIVFSTTNYHIFRSGMFSNKAGLKADGIGAKTKWYFWPNALIREFIGILVSEFKINIAVILAVVALSALFTNYGFLLDLILK